MVFKFSSKAQEEINKNIKNMLSAEGQTLRAPKNTRTKSKPTVVKSAKPTRTRLM